MFVSVKDAKPKRKVAVPIGDGASWEQFCSQVGDDCIGVRSARRAGARACPLMFTCSGSSEPMLHARASICTV